MGLGLSVLSAACHSWVGGRETGGQAPLPGDPRVQRPPGRRVAPRCVCAGATHSPGAEQCDCQGQFGGCVASNAGNARCRGTRPGATGSGDAGAPPRGLAGGRSFEEARRAPAGRVEAAAWAWRPAWRGARQEAGAAGAGRGHRTGQAASAPPARAPRPRLAAQGGGGAARSPPR